jgi:3D (Asp-Asp-Asp) domain-containing protein
MFSHAAPNVFRKSSRCRSSRNRRLHSKFRKEPKGDGVPKYIKRRLPAFSLIHLLADLQRVEKSMTWLITVVGFGLLLVSSMFAGEHSALARVTVYWHSEGSGANAAWNGARLRDGHCAVDPRKIPYGSQVVFHDAECVAVDTGPDVVNRKAARWCGRSPAERNAIVIDRFFDTKQNALAWAKANPHFMVVQVCTPDTQAGGPAR